MIGTIKPDLTAPRYRPKRYSVSDRKFIRAFRAKYPQYKAVPEKKIKDIIFEFGEQLWKDVIDNRNGIELPEGLGNVFIGACKTRQFNPNYKSSLEVGQRVRHRNLESDGYLAKIFYSNYGNKYKFLNRELWKFKGTRDFTRKVNETFSENWPNYVKVDNFTVVWRLFEKAMKTERILNRTFTPDQTYNEFDMD